ncbi:MAG: right-handed parallel beta-helix repeat-containing protein [Planctomycetaceae bacterium]|nr:right-handed parallel beta-helix repeat-containing protein [Planctomycetaceae bacterium]
MAPADLGLQRYIDEQVRQGRTRVVVPPGRYRMAPRDRQHLVLKDLKNVEIVADGVEMVCTETTRAVSIVNCTNLTFRGLTIDYDPLPFTQGRIVAMSADKKVHEIELFEGYPPAESAKNWKYEIFRPDTRTLRCDDRYPAKVEAAGPRRLRVTLPKGTRSNPERVGDLAVIASEHALHGSVPHAIHANECRNLHLENVTLYASNCFGFYETACQGSTYLRCRVDRRSPDADPVKRASPRLRSLNADAFHSKYATVGPKYIECFARFQGDDCIAINGDSHMIMTAQGRALRVLAKGRMNIQSGDPVEIATPDDGALMEAKAVTIEAAGEIRDDERAFLSKQKGDERVLALHKAVTITLDRQVKVARGGLIYAANRLGSGFEIRGCDFGQNRSRGLVIKASGGLITGNRFEGCRMSAILVSSERWWLEAGNSSDVAITANTITSCEGIAINVAGGVHRNISITGNTVRDCSAPGIFASRVRGLQIKDNSLELKPSRRAGAAAKEAPPIVRLDCD